VFDAAQRTNVHSSELDQGGLGSDTKLSAEFGGYAIIVLFVMLDFRMSFAQR